MALGELLEELPEHRSVHSLRGGSREGRRNQGRPIGNEKVSFFLIKKKQRQIDRLLIAAFLLHSTAHYAVHAENVQDGKSWLFFLNLQILASEFQVGFHHRWHS